MEVTNNNNKLLVINSDLFIFNQIYYQAKLESQPDMGMEWSSCSLGRGGHVQ